LNGILMKYGPNKSGLPTVVVMKRERTPEEMIMTQPRELPEPLVAEDQLAQAFEDGRRAGLATAAMALSLVSFLSLLGAEKALLAIALAIIARRGSQPGSAGRRLATMAIGVATVFLVSIAFILIVFWKELGDFVNYFRQLS
jgi:hypothetical protein